MVNPMKVRFLLFTGAFLLFTHLTLSQKMVKTKIAKEITMDIPENFTEMTRSEQRLKYVTSKEPIAMYTNDYRTVDIGVNFASTPWQGELSVLRDFYRSNTLALYDSINFLTDEIATINDREFIIHEFEGFLFGKKDSFKGERSLGKYIQVLYTLYGNKVILFTISTPFREKNRWQPIALEMRNSIKFKK